MSQNIYDDSSFFKAYTTLIDRSSRETTLEADPAWSRLVRLVPDNVEGMKILDLGCGSGWFARWAMTNGARSVLGIDISRNMIDKARSLTPSEKLGTDGKGMGIQYDCIDLEELKLPEDDMDSYDLVFSSLTLHYIADLDRLLKLIYRVLKPGCRFVFNVEHPIYTAPPDPRVVITDPETGSKAWALSGYHSEGERNIQWLGARVRKYHRTFTGYMGLFLGLGFQITGLIEWLPTPEELEQGTVDEVEALRPLFLMMSICKPCYTSG